MKSLLQFAHEYEIFVYKSIQIRFQFEQYQLERSQNNDIIINSLREYIQLVNDLDEELYPDTVDLLKTTWSTIYSYIPLLFLDTDLNNQINEIGKFIDHHRDIVGITGIEFKHDK